MNIENLIDKIVFHKYETSVLNQEDINPSLGEAPSEDLISSKCFSLDFVK